MSSLDFIQVCAEVDRLLRSPQDFPRPTSESGLACLHGLPSCVEKQMWQRLAIWCVAQGKPPEGDAGCSGNWLDAFEGEEGIDETRPRSEERPLLRCLKDCIPHYLLAESFLATEQVARVLHESVGWLNGSSLTIHHGREVDYASLQESIGSITMPFVTPADLQDNSKSNGEGKSLRLLRRLARVGSNWSKAKQKLFEQFGVTGDNTRNNDRLKELLTPENHSSLLNELRDLAEKEASERLRRLPDIAREDIVERIVEMRLLRAIGEHIKYWREEGGKQAPLENALADGFKAIYEGTAPMLWQRLGVIYIPYGELVFRYLMTGALLDWSISRRSDSRRNSRDEHPDPLRKSLRQSFEASGSLASSALLSWLRLQNEENEAAAFLSKHSWFGEEGDSVCKLDPWWRDLRLCMRPEFWQKQRGLKCLLELLSSSSPEKPPPAGLQTLLNTFDELIKEYPPNERSEYGEAVRFGPGPLVNWPIIDVLLSPTEPSVRAVFFLSHTPIRQPLTNVPVVIFLAGTVDDSLCIVDRIKPVEENDLERVLGQLQSRTGKLSVFTSIVQKVVSHNVIERQGERMGQQTTAANFAHELKRLPRFLANSVQPASLMIGDNDIPLFTVETASGGESAASICGRISLAPEMPIELASKIGVCFFPQGVRDVAGLMNLWCQASTNADLTGFLDVRNVVDTCGLMEAIWRACLRVLALASPPEFEFRHLPTLSVHADVCSTVSRGIAAELSRLTTVLTLASNVGLRMELVGSSERDLLGRDGGAVSWLGRAMLAILSDYALHTDPPATVKVKVTMGELKGSVEVRLSEDANTAASPEDMTEFRNIQWKARDALGKKRGEVLASWHTEDVVRSCLRNIEGNVDTSPTPGEYWHIGCELPYESEGV